MASAQELHFTDYEDLTIPQNCNGDYVHYDLTPYHCEEGTTTFTYSGTNVPSLTLYYIGKPISPGESFIADECEDYRQISVEFLVNTDIAHPEIVLTQSKEEHSITNRISMQLGYYPIERKITISDACRDTVYLLFPYGGTETSLILEKWDDTTWQKVYSTSYLCCFSGNQYPVSRNDTGRYRAKIRACYGYKSDFDFVLD